LSLVRRLGGELAIGREDRGGVVGQVERVGVAGRGRDAEQVVGLAQGGAGVGQGALTSYERIGLVRQPGQVTDRT
jgi:hypothetical protein